MPWLVAAQALGVALGRAIEMPPGPPLVAALQLAVCALLSRRQSAARAVFALALACAAGAAGSSRLTAPPTLAAPIEATVEGRLARVRSSGLGSSVELDALRWITPRPGAGLDRVRRIVTSEARSEGLSVHRVGSRVRARLRLRPPTSRCNPGLPDPAGRLANRGIAAVGGLVHPALTRQLAVPNGPWAAVERLRRHGVEGLAAHGRGGALLAALAWGDRDGIEADDREALRRLGLGHLLAVSGLHLGLVAGGAFAGVRRVARGRAADPRRAALWPALLLAGVYAVQTGMAEPVRRAWVFLAVGVVASRLRRPLPPGQALWVAAWLMLLFEPGALFSPSAQLSFAATAAIAIALGHARRRGAGARPGGLLERARVLFDTSVAAVLATTPIAAWHFGTASPVGWIANLVAVPWTAVALLPGALLAAGLGAVGASGAVAPFAEIARLSLVAAEAASGPVPAAVGLAPPPWAFGGAALLAVAGLRIPSSLARAAMAVVAGLLIVHAPPTPRLPPAPRLVALDVGQGDAVLVQGRTGSLLVDAGRAAPGRFDVGAHVVVPALRALGVRQLDVVAVTHADSDHRGGVPAVLRQIPTGEVWLPPGGLADAAFGSVVATAIDRGARLVEREAGRAVSRVGDLSVAVIWPPGQGAPAGDNAASLVLRVATPEGLRVLLPGDIERDSEAALVRSGTELRADVLLLPHHGSRTSSSAAFLEAVAPRLAIVSAPLRSRFGMPHAEVLRRLAESDVPLAWTGRDGAVRVGLTPGLPRHHGGCF